MPERFPLNQGKRKKNRHVDGGIGKKLHKRLRQESNPNGSNGNRPWQAPGIAAIGQIDHPCAPLCGRRYNFAMHTLRTTRVFYGWAVLVAFLFGLFAPALSHAMSHHGPKADLSYMAEICSASGTRHVMVLADDNAPAVPAVPDMSHCDLCCSHHHASFAPPPQPAPVLVLDQQRDPYPALFYHAPSPQFAWSPTQSRGPPSSLS